MEEPGHLFSRGVCGGAGVLPGCTCAGGGLGSAEDQLEIIKGSVGVFLDQGLAFYHGKKEFSGY